MKPKIDSIPWDGEEKGWSAKMWSKDGVNHTQISFRKACIVLDNIPELKKWVKEILKKA